MSEIDGKVPACSHPHLVLNKAVLCFVHPYAFLSQAWCLHESSKYVGMAILGSKSHGGLSSYALSVMILSLFNGNKCGLHHPLQVFGKFLQVFSTFDWSQQLLTHDGPVPLSCTYDSSSGPRVDSRSRFSVLVERLKRYSEDLSPSSTFPIRCCNILDPLNSSNNLGYSLNRQSLQFVQHALLEGRLHFEHVLGSNVLAMASLTRGMSSGSSNGGQQKSQQGGKKPADHGSVTPDSALWGDTCSTGELELNSISGSDDGNQSDSSSCDTRSKSGGNNMLKPWSSTLPPPANYPVAAKAQASAAGPSMAELASAALMSFFPRLYQLYASPSECRTDLLNHPCQSRTTMVCDDLPPGTTPPANKSALLSGDINAFWKNLSSTCDTRSDKPCRAGNNKKADGDLWGPLTPEKLVAGHGEYDDEEDDKRSDATGITGTRSEATSSPCSLSSLSSSNSPQPHESERKGLHGHLEPTALDLPPPSSTSPSPASRPSIFSPHNHQGEVEKPLGQFSASRPCGANTHALKDEQEPPRRLDAEEAETAVEQGSEGARASSLPDVGAEQPVTPVRPSESGSKRRKKKKASAPVGTSEGTGAFEAVGPRADVVERAVVAQSTPDSKGGDTKDVGCGPSEPVSSPPEVEDQLAESAPSSALDTPENGARTKKCGSRRRKKGTAVVQTPGITTASIAIQTDSPPPQQPPEPGHVSHQEEQQPQPRQQPSPPQASRGATKHQDKKHAVNRKTSPSFQDKEVQVRLSTDEDMSSSDSMLRPFLPRGILGVSSFLVLAYIFSLWFQGPSSTEPYLGTGPGNASSSATSTLLGQVAMASSSSPSFSSPTANRKEEAVLPLWVVAGSTLRLGDVPMDHGRKANLSSITFRWFKDGEPLEGLFPSSSSAFLVIQRVTPQHEGEYSCYRVVTGDGRGGEAQELVGFTHVRVLQPPQLTTKRRIQTSLQPGSLLALHVAAQGVPDPEYQWRLNGVPIPGARSHTYTVRNVDASHMGTYTCEVWNMAGKVMWEEAVIAMAPSTSAGPHICSLSAGPQGVSS